MSSVLPLLQKWLGHIGDPAKVHEVLFRPVRRLRMARRVTLPPGSRVSVVLVTNRPHQLDHAVKSFEKQDYPHKELVIVTNGGDFDAAALDALAARPDLQVFSTPATVSLGEALNLGVRNTSGRVIAKFDDDDHYGADYLTSAVATMRASGAGIVGKKTYYLYLAATGRTVRIYPGNENRRVGRVAGGTIFAHRDVVDRVEFAATNLGEDVRFVRAAERRGFGVFSNAAEGFLQWRAETGHTWQFDAGHVGDVSQDVGAGHDPSLWAGHL